MKWLLRALIKAYQITLSPLLGANCRYYPTCSHYALEALQILPLPKALVKIVWRVLRCNPFSRGGYDPVIKTPESSHHG